ncbi:hypothetical protein ABK040_016766 [Willaertia magna]
MQTSADKILLPPPISKTDNSVDYSHIEEESKNKDLEIGKQLLVSILRFEEISLPYEEAVATLKRYSSRCFEKGLYEECEDVKKALQITKIHHEHKHIENVKSVQIMENEQIDKAFEQEIELVKQKWKLIISETEKNYENSKFKLVGRHISEIEEIKNKFQEELDTKRPKYSKELLNLRKIQDILARQQLFSKALEIKKQADKLQEEENRKVLLNFNSSYEKKKAYLLYKQKHEIDSLELRFKRERFEIFKQRDKEIQRVVQRYQNLKSTAQIHHSQFESAIKLKLRKKLNSFLKPELYHNSLDLNKESNNNISDSKLSLDLSKPISRKGPRNLVLEKSVYLK